MPRWCSLLVAISMLGCAFAPLPTRDAPSPLPTGFESLRLSFTDPGTLTQYTIEGPYRHIRTSSEGVEIEGFDADLLQPARVLLFERDGVVWALTRIGGLEFLTRMS